MIDEIEFNHVRKRLLEIYHNEKVNADCNFIHTSRLRKLFINRESWIHKKGIEAILKEIGIKNDEV
jgi:hypothetical protein